MLKTVLFKERWELELLEQEKQRMGYENALDASSGQRTLLNFPHVDSVSSEEK